MDYQLPLSQYVTDLYHNYPVLSIEKTGEIGIACPDGKMEFYGRILEDYVLEDLYKELKGIARGEKPYRTEDNLSHDGMKLNGKVEIWFEGPLKSYDITIDSDVEKLVNSLIHTYIHERMHPEYYFEDSDAVIEYLTGEALYRLMNIEDKEVSALAKRGYESFVLRQNLLKSAVFGADSPSDNLYSEYCENDSKKVYTQV